MFLVFNLRNKLLELFFEVMKIKVLQCILLLFFVYGIGVINIFEFLFLFVDVDSIILVDLKVSWQIKVFYRNLKMIVGQYIMFGYQDDLVYGVMWRGGK